MSLSPASWLVGAGRAVRGGAVGGGGATVGASVGVSGSKVNVGIGVGDGVAGDGADALRVLHATRADVLVLDSDMRDLSGLEVVEALRRDGSTIRIVLYTLDGDACIQGKEIGVDACVTKDSAPSLLIDAIRGAAQVA